MSIFKSFKILNKNTLSLCYDLNTCITMLLHILHLPDFNKFYKKKNNYLHQNKTDKVFPTKFYQFIKNFNIFEVLKKGEKILRSCHF